MHERPTALIRAQAEDFQVVELPKVQPDGSGEHLLVRVRKRDATTPWAAAQLAAWAGVPVRAVSWAGMKDRHAVTEQWFSIHCIGEQPEVDVFVAPGVELLEVHRHSRKLRRGTLSGNAFRIVLRELSVPAATLALNVGELAAGVPNRFGRQRFGRGGRNLQRASRWFEGGARPRDRMQRGMLLSAARAALFNAVLNARVAAGVWATPIDGDIMVLDGRGSRFSVERVDPVLVGRCATGEIHPTGPLWGRGGSEATGSAGALEHSVVAAQVTLADGLERLAEPSRRPLRAIPRALRTEVLGADVLRIDFELPPGAYATSVLDQLVDWHIPPEVEGEPDVADD